MGIQRSGERKWARLWENVMVAEKKWGKERRPKCLKKQGRFSKTECGVEHGRENR